MREGSNCSTHFNRAGLGVELSYFLFYFIIFYFFSSLFLLVLGLVCFDEGLRIELIDTTLICCVVLCCDVVLGWDGVGLDWDGWPAGMDCINTVPGMIIAEKTGGSTSASCRTPIRLRKCDTRDPGFPSISFGLWQRFWRRTLATEPLVFAIIIIGGRGGP